MEKHDKEVLKKKKLKKIHQKTRMKIDFKLSEENVQQQRIVDSNKR